MTSSSAAPRLAPLGERVGERGAAGVVESRVRLVAEQQTRRVHHRARDRDALLEPAAQRARRRVGAIVDAHQLEGAHRRVARVGQTVEPRRELDVLARGEHAVQHARVAHEPDLRPRGGAFLHRDAVHPHRSLTGRQQAGEHPQQRRLPRPVRAEQREAVAGLEGEAHAVHGSAPAEGAHEPLRLHHGPRSPPSKETALEWAGRGGRHPRKIPGRRAPREGKTDSARSDERRA